MKTREEIAKTVEEAKIKLGKGDYFQEHIDSEIFIEALYLSQIKEEEK